MADGTIVKDVLDYELKKLKEVGEKLKVPPKPTVNEAFLALEECLIGKEYMKPFHLEHTRTTFFKIVKLSGWEHAKLEFFDGEIPLASCYMVNVTENDIKQMMKALALMLKRMEREKTE